jgi:hypothetical protein
VTYSPTTFVDDAPPAVSADELNKLGAGIQDAHDDVAALDGRVTTLESTAISLDSRVDALEASGGNVLRSYAAFAACVLTSTLADFTGGPSIVVPATGNYAIRIHAKSLSIAIASAQIHSIAPKVGGAYSTARALSIQPTSQQNFVYESNGAVALTAGETIKVGVSVPSGYTTAADANNGFTLELVPA